MTEDMNARDAKLVQYLNEAYGKEQELIPSLEAHIAMAADDKPYKKRLQEHLRETKRHAKDVERRIKQLGGKVAPVELPGPDVVTEAAAAGAAALSRGAALVKGQAHALRGTGARERMLKNAKTEYWNEFEEIATYYAIETLAEFVGDKETHKLARSIRREEERMARYLERQIPKLARAVGREEIPAALRNTGTRRRKRAAASGSSKPSASKRSASGSKRAAPSRRSASASGSKRTASSSGRKKTAAKGKGKGKGKARS